MAYPYLAAGAGRYRGAVNAEAVTIIVLTRRAIANRAPAERQSAALDEDTGAVEVRAFAAVRQGQAAQGNVRLTADNVQDPASIAAADGDGDAIAVDHQVLRDVQLTPGQHQGLIFQPAGEDDPVRRSGGVGSRYRLPETELAVAGIDPVGGRCHGEGPHRVQQRKAGGRRCRERGNGGKTRVACRQCLGTHLLADRPAMPAGTSLRLRVGRHGTDQRPKQGETDATGEVGRLSSACHGDPRTLPTSAMAGFRHATRLHLCSPQ